MNDDAFVSAFFDQVGELLAPAGLPQQIAAAADVLEGCARSGNKALLAGNGASAAMASHFALDFTKQGGVRSIAFNDAALLTAYGNDYGYEHWIAHALDHHADRGDAVVLISSSGRSPNVVRGAKAALAIGCRVVTLTGFAADNPLRKLGELGFWVPSSVYNVVESVHHTWLAAICDLLSHRADRRRGEQAAKGGA